MTLPSDQNRTPPWGIPATLAWLLFSFLASAIVAAGAFAIWQGDSPRSIEGYDGVVIAIGALASVPVQIGILGWAAQLRSWTPADYFALTKPRRGEMIVAVISIAVLDLAFNGLLYATGRDIVAPFQTEAYRTAQNAGWLVWLLIGIVVVAPAGEEIAFRGFFYRGLARPGWELYAIVAIAFAWALLHIQYDWLGMAQVFLLGILLGWFRWASGSTTLTILMHVLINLEAMIETAIKVEFLS